MLLAYVNGRSDNFGSVSHLLAVPAYGNVAAAFGAGDVLDLMERAAGIAVQQEGSLEGRLRPESRLEAHRQTLEAMIWLRKSVEQAREIEIAELERLAAEERISKVKSRILWMEKVGTVHVVGDVVRPGRAPESESEATSIGEVPSYKDYFSSEAGMDPAQLAFFKNYERRQEAGEAVELEGQWSYAFAYLGKVAVQFAEDLEGLRDIYVRFERDYPNTHVAMHCRNWRADVHFLLGDWQGGFDALYPEVPMDIYVTLAPFVTESRLQAATVEQWMTRSRMLTTSLRGQRKKVDGVLQELLDAAHNQLGRSVVCDLWERLVVDRDHGAPAPPIADEFGGFITQTEVDHYLENFDRRTYDRPRKAFQSDPRRSRAIDWPVKFCATYWFDQIVRARMQSLYRDAENIVRREVGMPAVGEGWISEVNLLNEVREAFPDRRVVHQGRPSWLGQQSLDIYLPDENIGIEYQGAQHSAPVALFGGRPAFERQLERDARKRGLCIENGCRLIEVHPGYDLESVITEIRETISR